MESRSVDNKILLGCVSELVSEGRPVVILAKGNSMSPFIRHGRDSVELRSKENPEPGDIALAEISPGVYVLHRIISADGDEFVLKGDGNLDLTERCSRDDVRAVAVKILRPGFPDRDCTTPCFGTVSRIWRNSPRFFRRIVLGVYRRIKIL